MEQSRFKSWALWVAIAALIGFCAKQFFGLDISEPINGLMDYLLPVVALLGIVNNPTNAEHI